MHTNSPLIDALNETQFKALARRYVAELKKQGQSPALSRVQEDLARALGHPSLHAAQQRWKQSTPPSLDRADHVDASVELSVPGLEPWHVLKLADACSRRVGLFIITGTWRSGKSTLLHQMTDYVAQKWPLRILLRVDEAGTVYQADYRGQGSSVEWRPAFSGSLSAAASFILRCEDPDITVAIDTLASNEHGALVERLVASGIHVLASCSASGAFGAVERLRDFGIKESYLTKDPNFFIGAAYVQLLPQLCSVWAQTWEYDPEDHPRALSHTLMGLPPSLRECVKTKNAQGCAACGGTGLSKKTLCAELFFPSPRQLYWLGQDELARLNAYRDLRNLADKDVNSSSYEGKIIVEHALTKVLRGQLCPLAVDEKFGPYLPPDSLAET